MISCESSVNNSIKTNESDILDVKFYLYWFYKSFSVINDQLINFCANNVSNKFQFARAYPSHMPYHNDIELWDWSRKCQKSFAINHNHVRNLWLLRLCLMFTGFISFENLDLISSTLSYDKVDACLPRTLNWIRWGIHTEFNNKIFQMKT